MVFWGGLVERWNIKILATGLNRQAIPTPRTPPHTVGNAGGIRHKKAQVIILLFTDIRKTQNVNLSYLSAGLGRKIHSYFNIKNILSTGLGPGPLRALEGLGIAHRPHPPHPTPPYGGGGVGGQRDGKAGNYYRIFYYLRTRGYLFTKPA